MGFYARTFTYADQSSELYSLEIANVDGGGLSSNPGSGSVEIVEQFIYARPVPYFYGVKYAKKLEFPVSFFSPNELTAVDLSYIQSWLFGRLEYERLGIIQADMNEFYLNCIFVDPRVIRVGNVIYGISGTCVADSQFGWTYPKTITYDYSGSSISGSFIFYNNSHFQGYLRPELTIKTGSSGGNISIVNHSDNDREFSFTDLSPVEELTVNNDLCVIESSTGERRLTNFNKNFFRLVPGINNISVSGSGFIQLAMTYQFVRRLGG